MLPLEWDMFDKEKVEKVKVLWIMSDSVTPQIVLTPLGFCVHVISQASILEWVAIPFSSRSSQPMDETWVSCIAGRFFIVGATKLVVSEFCQACSSKQELSIRVNQLYKYYKCFDLKFMISY